MSVILYKDGEPTTIKASMVIAYLEAGWSTTNESIQAEEKASEEEAKAEVLSPAAKEADTNNSGKLSTFEVRAAAKAAGIEGYDKKRIATLKKELGYDD